MKFTVMLSMLVILFCIRDVWGGLNFVLVLTDDQDIALRGLDPMKKTLKLVANKGVTFQNAFTHTPICCPSRSALLTGKYLHRIHVFNNSISGNCSSFEWQNTHEHRTFPALLKDQRNYKTFYAGKYLNQYGAEKAGGISHIPKGYDWWIGLKGNSKYYNYTLSINGTAQHFRNEYLTDVISSYALQFLNSVKLEKNPFFMMLAPPAAHAPFTPASRHVKMFPGMKALRTPAFNHSTEKKHWLMQLPPVHLPDNVNILDDIHRRRQQTLLAVDEMMESIVKTLKKFRVLDKTYILFTSDNGFHIGQFGMPWDKRLPYDTDVRIPLLMRGPNIKKKWISEYPISTIDIGPTILELAGIQVPQYMDGLSFKYILDHPEIKYYERKILTLYYGEGNANSVDTQCQFEDKTNLADCSLTNWCKCQDSRNNTYACMRDMGPSRDFKDCLFIDDKSFEECYDLRYDPYELRNVCDRNGTHRSSLLNMFKV